MPSQAAPANNRIVKITYQRARAEWLCFNPNQKCEKAEASHPGGQIVAASSIFNDLCLSTSLPVQLALLHLDKPGNSTSSPHTMAEDTVTSDKMHPLSEAHDANRTRLELLAKTPGSFVTLPFQIRCFIEFSLDHFLSRLCFCLLLLSLPWGLFNEEAC